MRQNARDVQFIGERGVAKLHDATPYHTLWLKGGFPEPLLTPELNSAWMDQFYTTYVYRDIGTLFPRLDKVKFKRFFRILGDLSGTILNKSNIGRSIESNESTVRDYFDIADGTFVWKRLPSYEKSQTKSLVKMPKGYLRDSGMRHYLLNIHTYDQLLSHPQVRTRNGAEIDLILEGSFGILPIEIKHGLTTRSQDLHTLRQFIQENKLPFGLIISQNPKVQWLTPEILHVPMGCL